MCQPIHLLVVLAALQPCTLLLAQPSGEVAKEILSTGWEKNSSSYQSARRSYDAAVSSGTADARAQYAMALVCLHHNRPQAEELLIALRASPKPMLPIRKTALWTHLARRNHAEAQAAVAEIASRLPMNEAEVTADHESLADLLGAAAGFLTELPPEDKPEARAALLEAIHSVSLKGSLQERFEASKERQTQRHQELRGKADALRPGLASKARELLEKTISNAVERIPKVQADAEAAASQGQKWSSEAERLESLASDERKAEDRRAKRDEKDKPSRSGSSALKRQAKAAEALADSYSRKAESLERSIGVMRSSMEKAQQSLRDIETGTYDFPGITSLERTRQSWALAYPLDLEAEKERLLSTIR